MKTKLPLFNFSELDASIVQQGYYIADANLSTAILDDLLDYYIMLEEKNLLRQARIGQGSMEQKESRIRNDHIFWIHEWNLTEGLIAYSHFLEALRIYLRENFRVPLKRFESHIACYPEGSFYKKHIDQHKWTMHRQFSVILYLSSYQEGNGGELVLYPKKKSPITVSPQRGKIVVFPSKSLVHEVLESRFKRISITSWMRDDLIYF